MIYGGRGKDEVRIGVLKELSMAHTVSSCWLRLRLRSWAVSVEGSLVTAFIKGNEWM